MERIRSLAMILTAECNLACRYCYQNAKRNKNMPWATAKASLDLVLGARSDEVQVVFLGGEPLLEFHLLQRVVEYVERKRTPGKVVNYVVSTNGTLLSEEIIAFFAAHSFALRISFDGMAQDARAAGTFALLDRLLHRLRAEREIFLKGNITICMTVTPATIGMLPESIAYFLENGAANISIGTIITGAPDWKTDRIDELDSLFARVFDRSLVYWQKTGGIPVLAFRRAFTPPPYAQENRPMCSLAQGESLTVDADGQVYGCPVLAGSYQKADPGSLSGRWAAMRMGSIHDPRFPGRHAAFPAAARRAGMFDRKQDKHSSYGRCRECRYVDACSVCPVSIVHVPGNNDPNRVSDFCCAYNLVSLKYRERFPGLPRPRNLLQGPEGAAADMERWRKMAEVAKSTGR